MTLTNHYNFVPASTKEQEHTVDMTVAGADLIFVCTCKARWTLARTSPILKRLESVRSHYISAGLKPSEVL